MSLFARLTRLPGFRTLLSQGVASKMYAMSVLSIVGFAAVTGYVAYFALQTRNSIQELEQISLAEGAVTTELEDLQRMQHGLINTFFLSPNHTFSKLDFERLQMLRSRLRTLNDGLKNGPVIAQTEFDWLDVLAGDLIDDSGRFDRQDKIATLREFLKASSNVDRQLYAAAASGASSEKQRLRTIVDMGDDLAGCVAIACALLIGLVVPVMIITVTRFVRRINRITRTMHRIADCETGIDVPSTVDIDEVGELARAVQVFKRNTIALQRNSTEMLRLNSWFDLALNNMHGGLSIFDHNQELVMCNERYLELYGLPKQFSRPGTGLREILQYWKDNAPEGVDAANFDIDKELETYRAAVAEQQEFVRVNTLQSGRTVLVSCRPSIDGGWVDVHDDVTDRIQSDQTIERLAHSDLLTGLQNRHSFMKSLGERLGDVSQNPELGVLLVDIINFKRINDVYGHECGDRVLQELATRLSALAGSEDSLARLGGDGFGFVKANAGRDAAADCARDMCAVTHEPIDIDGTLIEIGLHVGLALSPSDGNSAGELLQRAELALNQAKMDSGSGFAIFDPALENSMRELQSLKDDLKAAFELGQFELHYQPIMDYKTRQVASMEALMRWQHPTRGMVPPGIFIPIAEETGLISQLGQWAIGRACRDAMTWPDHVRVAVNLSAYQFQSGDLHVIAHTALRETGLPSRRLELEVTESLLLVDEQRTRRTLNRLKVMGIRIALDDFGTGYASLSYLRSFPFDKIKIDQTFVRDLPRDGDCNAIVRSVVLLARMLGMRTVAEGIETAEHLNQVVAAGCDEIQGYYLSRPAPASAVAGIIADCESRLAEAA